MGWTPPSAPAGAPSLHPMQHFARTQSPALSFQPPTLRRLWGWHPAAPYLPQPGSPYFWATKPQRDGSGQISSVCVCVHSPDRPQPVPMTANRGQGTRSAARPSPLRRGQGPGALLGGCRIRPPPHLCAGGCPFLSPASCPGREGGVQPPRMTPSKAPPSQSPSCSREPGVGGAFSCIFHFISQPARL